MKKIIFLIISLFIGHISTAQDFVVSYTDANTAANTLKGSNGITISNATFNGHPTQLALLTNPNGIIGFTNGVIITTGSAGFAQTNNTGNVGNQQSVSGSTTPDPDLNQLLGGTQYNPAIFEFDFTTTGAKPSFDYVFLSDEYNAYAGSQFHDVFGFFLSGPGINGTFSNNAINIATVPNTTNPVSVNTINACTNSTYYRNNCWLNTSGLCISQQSGACTGGSLNNHNIPYNAFTSVLQAKTTLNCSLSTNATYHCKIVIANINDANYDSGIILKAGSLNSDFSIGNLTASPQPVCVGQPLTLSVQGNTAYNYNWNTGQNGTGVISITTNSSASNNPYSVTATNADGCQITKSINTIIHTPQNVAPYINGINNTGNYIFYAQAGVNNCFSVPTFDTPGEEVDIYASGLPSGSTFNIIGAEQQVGQFCWTPPTSAIGDYTFTVNFFDNNVCNALSGSATITVRIGCPSCIPTIYYENRTPSSSPLPAFTKTGDAIIAGQSVDPNQSDGVVTNGTASVTFKAGNQVLLQPGFTAGTGFIAIVDPNTCITDCEDCCSHFPGITYEPIPNIFTPDGNNINDIWYVNDYDYPFCAYNAQYFDLQVFNVWENRVYHQSVNSATCCPFRAKSNPSDPTIPSIYWDGIANDNMDYSWFDEVFGGKVDVVDGQKVTDGTYYYILNIAGCNTSVDLTGFITLLGNNPRSMIVPADSLEYEQERNIYVSNLALEVSKSENELLVYPNPAGILLNIAIIDKTIATQGCQVTFFDFQGKSVLEKYVFSNQQNSINIHELSPGVYVIKANYNNQLFTKTFIKLE